MSSIVVMVTNDLNQDQRMHRLCTAMMEVFEEVTLLGREKKKSLDLLKMPFTQERLLLPFESGPFFYAMANMRYLKYLFRVNPDVVYCVDYDTLMAGYWYKKYRPCKIIFDAHEYFTEVPELKDRPRVKGIWEKIGKLCIPKCDLCITVNKSLAVLYEKEYGVKFHVIRNVPISKDFHREMSIQDKKIILYQGVLNKGRGLEVAIDTISEMDDYEFWIVGEGDLSLSLRAHASKLNQFQNIHFMGWKSPEELDEITAQADIGLNVLESDSLNYYYSLANKFFDYMQAGIPSINMNFPEYQAINNRHEVAVLIDKVSKEELRQAIRSLEDEEYRSRLSKQITLAKAEYNWEMESEKFLDLIRSFSSPQ